MTRPSSFLPRRTTHQVMIGDVGIGSDYPIRIQSMTTADPMDTERSIAEAIGIVESGAELVRFTTPDLRSAKNLNEIKNGLRKAGIKVPLVADIHYTPNAAETAARIVEKVRINPGNYADKKSFKILEYTDESYRFELERIREKFLTLIKICKEYGTALRIGTNHGSLSDRIMNRYGDTSLGMVESALEFVRICEDENFYDIDISLKASNPIIMVEANLLLVQKLKEQNLKPYPLHLGVTEAGDGEEGRVKSALGIGTLLDRGMGDTIRISLTESPEKEAPVAVNLLNRYQHNHQNNEKELINNSIIQLNNEVFKKTKGKPLVIADYSEINLDNADQLSATGHYFRNKRWLKDDRAADMIYIGNQNIKFELPTGLKVLSNYKTWKFSKNKQLIFPCFTINEYLENSERHEDINFIFSDLEDLEKNFDHFDDNVFLILNLKDKPSYIQSLYFLEKYREKLPLIIFYKNYKTTSFEEIQLNAAIDFGGLFMAGFGNGIMINSGHNQGWLNKLSFNVLQSAGVRITKTEFISCPSCGRTQFDLQEVTGKVKEKTSHLKGLKIAVMGCIVNGPGEMADADYGYVGSGKNRISLYRGKEIVLKNIDSANAVDELIKLIKADGKWINPNELY